MVDANITNHTEIHVYDFTYYVLFADNVTGFTDSNITTMAVDGNGITNVMFSAVMGTGALYSVSVSLPADRVGSFSIELSGQVDVSGQMQDINATTQTFSYDTVTHVAATFDRDNIRYNDDGSIELPVIFGEDVQWFDKTDLQLEYATGDDPQRLQHYIRGAGANYDVVFVPGAGTAGAVVVKLSGIVRKASDLVREMVSTTPVLIAYNNLVPAISDITTPYKTEDGYWNTIVTFETPVQNLSVDDMILGINTSAKLMYVGLTLDVMPAFVGIASNEMLLIGDEYDPTLWPSTHYIGQWQYIGTNRTMQQGRYFYIKFISDDVEMPKIALHEEARVRTVNLTP